MASSTQHTVGWSELEPLLPPCTPEWGERVTGVPAGSIERAGRIYGEGPSLLWMGQGFQRQRFGGNAMRACAMLPAITGNVGKPGAGFLYLNGTGNRGIDDDDLAGSHLAPEPPTTKGDPISQMDLAAMLEDPDRSRAFVCWNINPAASSPEQARLRRALARDDLFTVVVDLFPTDTAAFADVVLPAASFLEFDDLVVSYFDRTVSAQVKATEPIGQRRCPTRRSSAGSRVRWASSTRSCSNRTRRLSSACWPGTGVGVDFAAARRRSAPIPFGDEPIVPFADLRFPTPSGRIEIASERAERDGHHRVPQPTAEPRPEPGRFRLLSPASPWLMNDSFANDARIERKLGEAWVAMHPEDARERGLGDGDAVRLSNATGSLRLRLRVSDEVLRGVLLSPKGRWPKREPSGANVNALNPGQKADMAGSTAVHSIEVSVDPVG